jgi:hypothetical protein
MWLMEFDMKAVHVYKDAKQYADSLVNMEYTLGYNKIFYEICPVQIWNLLLVSIAI